MVLHWHPPGGDPVHPLLVVLLALAIDAALGDPPWLWRRVPHPVALFGAAAGRLERLLNRGGRGRAPLLLGAAATAALAALAAGAGWAIHAALAGLPLGWVAGAAAGAVLIAYRSLHDHVRAVADGLERSTAEGRAAVAHIVGRDTGGLDGPGVARAATESLAENLSDGVVAPVLWFALLGLPGLFACKAVNTLDSMFGHRTARHGRFGRLAARLDDAVNAVPARVTGLLIAAAAGRGAGAAWGAMVRDAARHRSVNAGWPEAAMAGALGLALAGPRSYGGRGTADAWLNAGGRRDAGPADIRRALRVYRRAAGALAALLLAGVALA